MRYCKECQIDLPERTDRKYSVIGNYPDYAFTYCIAYEMLIRTEEFKKVKIKPQDESIFEWEEKVKRLGLNPYAYPFEEMYISPIADVTFALNEHLYAYTIDDVDNGLDKLIVFYLDNNEVYLIRDEYFEAYGIKIPRYKKADDITLEEVFTNLSKYYIPCNPDRHIVAINAIEPIKQLDKNIPLDLLEKKFLATLSSSDLKEKYIQIEPRYKRPVLRFQENKIINLPVNLNLPKEELVEYISKIKDEYDYGHAQIKNPLERIGKIFKKVSRFKNTENLRQHKNNKKVGMADAFFVYDIYQVLFPYFENKKKEIVQKKEDEIKKIRQRHDIDKVQKDTLIQDEKECANVNKKLYAKVELNKKISRWGKLPEYNIDDMYKLMKEYIEDLKYKELITGVSSKKN